MGKNHAGWFEPWFDHPAYPVLYAHRDQTEADAWVDTLVHKVFDPSVLAGPVLDCGCGHGRHARRLADHGIPTVGLDLSAARIAEASALAHHRLSFIQGDARILSTVFPPAHFRAVLSLFTSFGYLNSPAADALVLQEIHTVLQPSGLFLLDYLHAEHVRAGWVPYETIERTDLEGCRWSFEVRRSEADGGFVKAISIQRDGVSAGEFTEFVRAYTPSELQSLLEQNGFEPAHLWGDYDLGPFSAGSPRCIIAAIKR